MITVSLCEIKPLYLRSKCVKVTLQEGQLKQIENILLDSALGGFLLPYLAKRQYDIKIDIHKTKYKVPIIQGKSLELENTAPVSLENNRNSKIHAFKRYQLLGNHGPGTVLVSEHTQIKKAKSQLSQFIEKQTNGRTSVL